MLLPLSFLLFIDDMPKVAGTSQLSLFADNATCHRKVSSHTECQLLWNDLNIVYYCGERW